ncbi:hypothetical protein A4U88_0022 [Serratia marcescens]|nr:hypothetical protein A4U88_0022 [Serratia marcescens]
MRPFFIALPRGLQPHAQRLAQMRAGPNRPGWPWVIMNTGMSRT